MFAVIKDFNRDFTWKNEDEIRKELKEACVGKSVTLVTLLPSGIRKLKFVTVDNNGILHDTYTKAPVTIT